MSPIPEGELEIPIQMTFRHTSKAVVEKMKLFVESQLVKLDQVFRIEDDEQNPDDDETKDVLDNDGDKELIQGGGNSGEVGTSTELIVIAIDNEQQLVAESEEEIRESVRKEINEALNAHVEDGNVMDLDI